MRRVASLLVLSLLIVACARTETAQNDTAAMAMTPAALTDADFSGTWKGTAMMEGSDSVFVHWTQVCAAGSCTGTSEESKDTVMSTYRIDADSSIGVTSPYVEPSIGTVQVIDHWVARVSNGRVTGNGRIVLADRPDSVVMRYRFEGSRTAP
jgi:hypothetical protein